MISGTFELSFAEPTFDCVITLISGPKQEKVKQATLVGGMLYVLVDKNPGLRVYSIKDKTLKLEKTYTVPQVTIGQDKGDIAINKDGSEIYIADYKSKKVVTFQIQKNSLSSKRTCNLPCKPTSLSTSPSTPGDLLVTCADDKRIVNCTANTATAKVRILLLTFWHST